MCLCPCLGRLQATADNHSSQLRAGVEALEVENVSLNEVLLHLVKLVPADGIDVATLQLLLEDLRDRNLTEIGADT